MALTNPQLEELYSRYLNNQCSAEDLQTLLNEFGEDSPVFQQEVITNLFDKTWDDLKIFPGEYPLKTTSLPKGEDRKAAVSVAMYQRHKRIFALSAVAAVLFAVLTIGFFLYSHHRTQNDRTIAGAVEKRVQQHDAAPGSNKALLTLADGSIIVLDSAANGKIAEQGNIEVIKQADGRLVYDHQPDYVKSNAIFYNKITTPRGGQYQLTLPDGSNVWLNATSSLHFPGSFIGDERKVQLTGEAYFEVAKDKDHPFIVEFGKNSVRVLGTEFNIMAYEDEPHQQTTLINGSVLLQNLNKKVTLKPGVMGVLNQERIELSNVDVERITAWKDGRIALDNTDIPTLMRQISRWYDVDIVYKGPITNKLIGGFIDRNVNLSAVLKVLRVYGINCVLTGKTVIVSS